MTSCVSLLALIDQATPFRDYKSITVAHHNQPCWRQIKGVSLRRWLLGAVAVNALQNMASNVGSVSGYFGFFMTTTKRGMTAIFTPQSCCFIKTNNFDALCVKLMVNPEEPWGFLLCLKARLDYLQNNLIVLPTSRALWCIFPISVSTVRCLHTPT